MIAPSFPSPSQNPSDTNLLTIPTVFPHLVTEHRLIETNLSILVLTGHYVYKIKKSVTFSFVDQSTILRRKALCDEEVRINQRLSSDLYEGVVSITRDLNGLAVSGTGPVVDYAVKLKQFNFEDELSTRLQRGLVKRKELADLGTRLADFHQSLPSSLLSSRSTCTEDLHNAVLGSLATVLCHPDAPSQMPVLGSLVDWLHDYLHDSNCALRGREVSGHVRECHGDLHVQNVVRWHGELVPFDSLEFDPGLRWIDTMNDAAFLFMDLISRHRGDLAFAFLNAYLIRGGDYEGIRLLRFYAVYRALVRAMVDLLAAEKSTPRAEWRNRARERLNTALSFINMSPPVLILMHGLSGSGKSWLGERLAEQLGAVQVCSDVERRRPADGKLISAVHTTAVDERTYNKLLSCAGDCLQGGFSAIVDGAFLERVQRNQFRNWAACRGISCFTVACHAPVYELEARIWQRRQIGTDPSDAGILELRRQLKAWVPMGADEANQVVSVDTMLCDSISSALSRIRSLMRAVTLSPISTTKGATA